MKETNACQTQLHKRQDFIYYLYAYYEVDIIIF